MLKHDAVTNNFLAIVDSWQEYKGGEKINPELADIIEKHLEYVFVAGFDEIAIDILRLIRKQATSDGKITASYLRTIINNKYYDNEIHTDDL